ncbi:hypothetical protein JYU34_015699 [Plutella xylostella]|uniref:G-protein coupled receptors family 1 profile domain-containing protein n=1 Tax=Plutella xylostella TaxID=51655 RepID=A0ABQ7Q5W9_PLUXY|nr:hypothetical protein JYU34_015699 [Plutella xylostella]
MLSTPTQTILSTEKSIDVRFWDYFNMEVPQPMNASEIADGPMNVSASVLIANPQPGFIVGVYSVLLVIGALGNVAVFTSLVRSRRRKSRVNLLMTHLASADLIVTAFCIPLEVCL